MCANFQTKRNTLTFLTKICPKMNFRVEIQKTNVGIKISILEILYVPTFRQNGQLWLFGLKFAQKWILGSDFQRTDVGIRISTLEIPCEPIFRQNGQLWLFGPKFAQKWILESEFQKSKPQFEINTSNIPWVPIFSQNGQLLSFWPKFGEIAQLRAIFWFKYCWGCCRELGGGWNELGGGGWSWVEAEMSWVEVDGAGWRWVHGLVMPKLEQFSVIPLLKLR